MAETKIQNVVQWCTGSDTVKITSSQLQEGERGYPLVISVASAEVARLSKLTDSPFLFSVLILSLGQIRALC